MKDGIADKGHGPKCVILLFTDVCNIYNLTIIICTTGDKIPPCLLL